MVRTQTHATYMTEDVVTTVEFLWELIVRIVEVLEAIFPEAHVLEATERTLVGFNPVRRAEGHQKEYATSVGNHSPIDQSVCKKERN